MALSPRLSFKGYNFGAALHRNKDLVKNLILVVTGYTYFTGFDFTQFSYAVVGSMVVLAGKLIQDLVDFYFTEVELDK
jgi:large-conductance mechanosensitive channel